MSDAGWKAALDLSFVWAGDKTALHERRHSGPLRVQRPFYPEKTGVCHVYLLHPPGGLVAGDTLRIEARVESNAHALLTTPAASKLYRSPTPQLQATQTQRLCVSDGAWLEWLPQETIAFCGARAELSTRVELTGDARFIGWEILCLGRPAAQETFDQGVLRPQLELSRDGRLVYVERGLYEAGSPLLQAAWGLQGQPVVGTLVCAAPDAARCIEPVRARLAALDSAAHGGVPRLAASAWDDCLLVRYLGPSAEQARIGLAAAWEALRPSIMGVPAVVPRIWRT
jgi:urease accessory protein